MWEAFSYGQKPYKVFRRLGEKSARRCLLSVDDYVNSDKNVCVCVVFLFVFLTGNERKRCHADA